MHQKVYQRDRRLYLHVDVRDAWWAMNTLGVVYIRTAGRDIVFGRP